MKKNILIIFDYYPPIQHVAANRIYSFAKYLADIGHQITVLTADGGEEEESEFVHKRIEVVRVKPKYLNFIYRNKSNNRFLYYSHCLFSKLLVTFFHDRSFMWKIAAMPVAREMVRKKVFDCMISSYPTLASHHIAYTLKKENPKISWIMDMRDAMSWSMSISSAMKAHLEKVEKNFYAASDAVTSISKPQLKRYEENAAKCCSHKIIFSEIRNGYDFKPIKEMPKVKTFKVIYLGSIYGSISPKNFFSAVSELLLEKKVDFIIEFIGVMKPIRIPVELKERVFFLSRMNYETVIHYLQNQAALLLLIRPSQFERGVYSGKIFDYLGCCKPILGLVPKDDVAAQLIVQANVGYIAENEKIEEIKEMFLAAYDDWKNNVPFNPNMEIVSLHHRKRQVEKLNKVIEKICKKE